MERSVVVILAGGGSGGHLTPLIAVADSLKKMNSDTKIFHVGQSGELLQNILDNSVIDKSYSIKAGKFRRYNGETFLQHLTDYKTILLNIRDFFRFLVGTFQAWKLLGNIKPDSIFLKGGFVCVPVGIAARLRKIPYVTHDSDAVPGLANRITAKHAVYNAVALEPSVYPYEKSKTVQVGIPIQEEYKPVSVVDKNLAKTNLGLSENDKVLFCVGGGQGAQNLNETLITIAKDLFSDISGLKLIHLTGKKLYQESESAYQTVLTKAQLNNLKLVDFSTELYNLSKAADVVITRGGATNIAEFAAQAKPCIVVPNPVLTGGQQLHNAEILMKNNAAIIVEENDGESLESAVLKLFSNKDFAFDIADNLNKLFVSGSSEKIADLLSEIAEKK